MRVTWVFCLILTILLVASTSASSSLRDEVRFEQRLGQDVAADSLFTDETGRTAPLREYLGTLPVILVFAYYRCPNLCTLVLNGLSEALRQGPAALGKDYRVLTVSIDPSEKPPLALAKQRTYLARMGLAAGSSATDSWRFLTGTEPEIRRLAESTGFRYHRDPATGEYAHPSGIIVLSPRGRISQYFFGIQFDPSALERALRVARTEKTGTWTEEILLYCFHYDPRSSRNGPLIMKAIRLTGAGGALALIGLLAYLFASGKREGLA